MLAVSWLEMGGVAFWVLVALAVFVTIFNIEENGRTSFVWPFMVLCIFSIIFFLVYKEETKRIFESFDGRVFIYSLIGYIILGIAWSFFKWFKFVKRSYKDFKTNYDAVVEENKRHEEEEKNGNLKRNGSYRATVPDKKNYMPDVTKNKEQISAWILFWPFSALRYIIGNALVDFLNGIVDMFKSWYNKITENQFKD